jgi:hypothetical protein
MSEVLSKIKIRGYWEVLIRPTKFVENRIENLGECKKIMHDLTVRLRGWPYPCYDDNNPPTAGIDYIEQSLEWQHHLEFWRYYQSGQFILFFSILEDWQDQAMRLPLKPVEVLDILSILYSLTEIYEFASRLAAKELLGDSCRISITLHRTKNRQLIMLDRRRLHYLRMMF